MTIKCNVLAVNPLASKIYQVLLQPERRVEFKAGQYLLAVMGEQDKRPFSIANAPIDQSDTLELHIGADEKNPYAFEVVTAAQRALTARSTSFMIEAPQGMAWLREPITRPLLLIAGGTGFSYVHSLLSRSLALGTTQPIFVYWGVREASQLYAHSELNALKARHNNLHYVPVVEHADGAWQGKTGRLLDAILADFASLAAFDIYIAGRFEMSRSARDIFCQQRQAQLAHFFSDAF